jgi:hypothetical protein
MAARALALSKATAIVALSLMLACGDSGDGGGPGGRGSTGGSGGGDGVTVSGRSGSGGSTSNAKADGGAARSDMAGSETGSSGGGLAGDYACTGGLAPPGNSPLTRGWKQMPFEWKIHSPSGLPVSARYSCDKASNTHTTWVLSTDSPFQGGTGTDPGTEMRWTNEYRGGQVMFDADVWIAPRTNGTCIMQVYQTTPSPTSFMLTAWPDATLRYYFGSGNGPLIKSDAFGKWMNLKVLHDVPAGRITVYIDDQTTMSFGDRGGSQWYFKNGVNGSRGRSETRWRNMRYWVKP